MVWNRIKPQPCEAFQMKQNPSMTISHSISKNTWLELSKGIKKEQNHTKEVLESLESDIFPDTNCHHFEYSCPRLNTASCWPWVWPPAPSSAQVHWKPRHNPGPWINYPDVSQKPWNVEIWKLLILVIAAAYYHEESGTAHLLSQLISGVDRHSRATQCTNHHKPMTGKYTHQWMHYLTCQSKSRIVQHIDIQTSW